VDVNLPEVVAEIEAIFTAYEAALLSPDLELLAASFWDSEHTVRYGVNELQYGAAAIAEWRETAFPLAPGRKTGPTVIATFGPDVAAVSTEFRNEGGSMIGRQSQTWIRFPEGWKIVAAHVSLMPPPVQSS
jgi:AtzH-like